MSLSATAKEAARSIWGVKQRSFLVVLGVSIGIGAFIAMVSLGEMVRAESIRQIKEAGIDIITISFDAGSGRRGGRDLTVADAEAVAKGASLVKAVAPEASFGGPAKVFNRTWWATMKGVTASYREVFKLTVAEGRFLGDLDNLKRVAVVGSGVVTKLRELGQPQVLDAAITLQGQKYVVVGILAPKSVEGRSDPNDEVVFVPLATAQRASSAARISQITARVKKDKPARDAAKEIEAVLAERLGTTEGLRVNTQEALIKQLEEQMRLYALLLGLIGSISLLVGGIGIMNMMLVAVNEKRKEIGIRRALGARQLDIQLQFLCESSFLSLIGSVVGIGLGLGTSRIVATYAGLQAQFSWFAVVVGLATAVVVGVFFGFYPARKASRLDPVMALRGE
jgi:putative ABC transport system permease protein